MQSPTNGQPEEEDPIKYINSLPRELKIAVIKALKHSRSIYSIDGTHWETPFEHEDLYQVLMGKERYVVDTNSNWKAEAKKPENRDKAFIIGRTLMNEEINLRGVFFGSKVDTSNNNIFMLTLDDIDELVIAIGRLDAHFRITLNEDVLDRMSQPVTFKQSSVYQIYQQRFEKRIANEKQAILNILEVSSLSEINEELKNKKVQSLCAEIRDEAPRCSLKFDKSFEVALSCYALLLLKEGKIRTEFNALQYKNVFGDLMLIHDALLLQANVLSNDRAGVHKMMRYIGNPSMRAVRTV